MRGGGGGPRAGGSCDGHMHRHARHPSGLPLPLGLQNIAGGVEAHPFEGGPRGVKVHSGGGPSRQDIRFFAEEVPKSSAVGRRLPLPMRSSAPLGHEPPGPGGRGGRGAGGAVGGGGGDMPGHDQRSVGPAASRGGGGLASSEIERACTGGALSRVRARPRDPPPRLPPRAAHPGGLCIRKKENLAKLDNLLESSCGAKAGYVCAQSSHNPFKREVKATSGQLHSRGAAGCHRS
mmetsp:Transcript_50569/g.161778  ORF Transcript_50569/g.161778 Transcript_50569/m.161778 type:complete len:234 (-) Transcript_50569:35-736(-)